MGKTESPSNAAEPATKASQPQQALDRAEQSMTAEPPASSFDRWAGSAIDGGSPSAPPEGYGSLLERLPETTNLRTGVLRHLQRSYGNSYVGQVIQREPGDGQHVQRAKDPTRSTDATTAEDKLEKRIQTAAAGGAGMDQGVRAELEQSWGTDLSDVRVHTDGEADELASAVDAVAFTTGRDIFFRSGAYKPDTGEGRQLLAHEAAHTVQQGTQTVTGVPATGGLSISQPDDQLEKEADRAAQQVMGANPVSVQRAPQPGSAKLLQRKPKTPDKDREKEAAKLKQHLPALKKIADNAVARHQGLMNYVAEGVSIVDRIADRFGFVAEQYTMAYGIYKAKVEEAAKTAATEDAYKDAVVGVAIGVAIAFMLPEVAAGAIATKFLWETGGELAELGVGKGPGAIASLVGPPDTEIKPEVGLGPHVVKLKQADSLIKLYRDLSMTSTSAAIFMQVALAAKDVIGDIKGYSAGENEHPLEKIETFITDLQRMDEGGKRAEAATKKGPAALMRLWRQVESESSHASVEEMEKDIWIRWIAGLSFIESKDIFGDDTLQPHLRSLGIIGADSKLDVDFGGWSPFDTWGMSDRPHRMAQELSDAMDLVGQEGTATTDVNPVGLVRVAEYPYDAFAVRGSVIKRGDQIRVVGTRTFGEQLSKRVALEVVNADT